MIMKKRYDVHIYYHGSYYAEIDADSEQEAIEKAMQDAGALDAEEFISATDLCYDGADAYEQKQ